MGDTVESLRQKLAKVEAVKQRMREQLKSSMELQEQNAAELLAAREALAAEQARLATERDAWHAERQDLSTKLQHVQHELQHSAAANAELRNHLSAQQRASSELQQQVTHLQSQLAQDAASAHQREAQLKEQLSQITHQLGELQRAQAEGAGPAGGSAPGARSRAGTHTVNAGAQQPAADNSGLQELRTQLDDVRSMVAHVTSLVDRQERFKQMMVHLLQGDVPSLVPAPTQSFMGPSAPNPSTLPTTSDQPTNIQGFMQQLLTGMQQLSTAVLGMQQQQAPAGVGAAVNPSAGRGQPPALPLLAPVASSGVHTASCDEQSQGNGAGHATQRPHRVSGASAAVHASNASNAGDASAAQGSPPLPSPQHNTAQHHDQHLLPRGSMVAERPPPAGIAGQAHTPDIRSDGAAAAGQSSAKGSAVQPKRPHTAAAPATAPAAAPDGSLAKRQRVMRSLSSSGAAVLAAAAQDIAAPAAPVRGARVGRPPHPKQGSELIAPVMALAAAGTVKGTYSVAAGRAVAKAAKAIATAVRIGACSAQSVVAAVESAALGCALPELQPESLCITPAIHTPSPASQAGKASARHSSTDSPALCQGWCGWCAVDLRSRGIPQLLAQAVVQAQAILSASQGQSGIAVQQKGGASPRLLPLLYETCTPHALSHLCGARAASPVTGAHQGAGTSEPVAQLLAALGGPVPGVGPAGRVQTPVSGGGQVAGVGVDIAPMDTTERCAVLTLVTAAAKAEGNRQVARGLLLDILQRSHSAPPQAATDTLALLNTVVSTWPEALLTAPAPPPPASPDVSPAAGPSHEAGCWDPLGSVLCAAISQRCLQSVQLHTAARSGSCPRPLASVSTGDSCGVSPTSTTPGASLASGSQATGCTSASRSSLLRSVQPDPDMQQQLAVGLLRELGRLPGLPASPLCSHSLPVPASLLCCQQAAQSQEDGACPEAWHDRLWRPVLGSVLGVWWQVITVGPAQTDQASAAALGALSGQVKEAVHLACAHLPGSVVCGSVLRTLIAWQPGLPAASQAQNMQLVQALCEAAVRGRIAEAARPAFMRLCAQLWGLISPSGKDTEQRQQQAVQPCAAALACCLFGLLQSGHERVAHSDDSTHAAFHSIVKAFRAWAAGAEKEGLRLPASVKDLLHRA